MDFLQTIVLGLIQGLTEWLPISSTGHLRLAKDLMGLQLPALFDGLLHVGTLVVTVAFFRKNIRSLLVSLRNLDFHSENGRLLPLIALGTLPTILIGFFFGDVFDAFFKGFLPLAGAFVLCGIVLCLSKSGKETDSNPSLIDAALIGTAQGLAIVPGISRSGVTIAIALLLGIRRERAFAFSFLLSIPAITGAVGLTFCTRYNSLVASGVGLLEVLLGVAFSMLIGYFALRLLSKVLMLKKLHLFAPYCWAVAVVLLGLSISGF